MRELIIISVCIIIVLFLMLIGTLFRPSSFVSMRSCDGGCHCLMVKEHE